MSAVARCAFVGGGNMATALVTGLLTKHILAPHQVAVSSPSGPKLGHLGVTCTTSNAEAVAGADVVLICVKPAFLVDALASCKDALLPTALIISVVAGVSLATLDEVCTAPHACMAPRLVVGNTRCASNMPTPFLRARAAARRRPTHRARHAQHAVLHWCGRVCFLRECGCHAGGRGDDAANDAGHGRYVPGEGGAAQWYVARTRACFLLAECTSARSPACAHACSMSMHCGCPHPLCA
ncbi:hypothetical protein EON66_03225 [archaeon]|nr:MAG: hypothetical protein EON66_03225 [archaeon]